MDPRASAVLVTVAKVEGSGPREAGARMLVGAGTLADTIGGGHLELRAIDIARAMLDEGRQRHLERFALGPSLGQCCGGVVHLAFERVDTAYMDLLEGLRQRDTWRLVALDGAPGRALFDEAAMQLAGDAAPLFARERGTHVMQEQDGRRWLVDLVAAPRAHLVLFGAGHVGAAIVRALAHLPCSVTWVDERDDMFPREVPPNVTVEASDTPEAVVAQAPANASYLVMTHSHALDQRLTQAIMERDDVLWFGLIGSLTKRRQFEHRLRERGVAAQRIAAMVCPIGLPGISGKEPAVIAAAVSAQLLMVWEQASKAEHTIPTLKLVAHARGRP
ncbi:xanthine dehydrogenase accessory protein XdhC [Massilia sp. PAMC28688]|uniref:xanthine dehydrogenase accessory protein XdhC n=1 Tax=Massilia sp. PAMC28688 TaxID=2861283 RepID=UPI001C6398C6|nr:xanthine dehydrogenase accessory protein XdhC [Massilia sp. PAMC28688]QYF94340.1 xanthine dehydrogenase accessory protein XdhC [Massilia sp. PAMC28688]